MKKLFFALCTALLVLSGLTPVALADDTAPTSVIDATNNPSDPSQLLVTFTGTTAVASVTATLTPVHDTSLPTLTVADFTLGTFTAGGTVTQSATAPAPVPDTAPDMYAVTVQATDTGGAAVGLTASGNRDFSWLITPHLTIAADPMTVDPAHQTVHISGALTGTLPDGTDAGALAGVALAVGEAGTAAATVATGSDGGYGTDVRPVSKTPVITASVATSDTRFADGDAQVTLNVQPGQAALTLHGSAAYLDKGAKYTVSGTLTVMGTSGWAPFAGQPVQIIALGTGGAQQVLATATTGSTGGYSYTGSYPGTPVQLEARWDAGTSAYPAQARTVTIATRYRPGFASIHLSYTAHAVLTIKGVLHDLNPASGAAKLLLQYSATGKGGWQTKKTLTGVRSSFTGTLSARPGYWRVEYAGDGGSDPAVSTVHKAWRWATYFTGFKVKRAKAHVTATGTLHRYTSKTHKKPYAKRYVYILFRFSGKRYKEGWYRIGRATTNAKGAFAKTLPYYGSGHYEVVFNGTTGVLAASTNGKLYLA